MSQNPFLILLTGSVFIICNVCGDWTFGKLDLLHLNLKLSLHQDLFFIGISQTWMQNNCGKDFILLKMKRQGAIDIGYLKKKFK